MDCKGLLNRLSVEKLGQGEATPVIGNQVLGFDADIWSRNEQISYGKHRSFMGELKVLSIH